MRDERSRSDNILYRKLLDRRGSVVSSMAKLKARSNEAHLELGPWVSPGWSCVLWLAIQSAAAIARQPKAGRT